MKSRLYLKTIIIFGLLFSLTKSLYSEERDPFLSPFEPRKIVPKEVLEVKKSSETPEKIASALNEDTIKELKKLLSTNQPEKADTALIEYKKALGDKALSDTDAKTISEIEDQIKNFSKYKELLKSARELMTVEGKILLKDKKNILLVNNQPVAEGEDLMDLLKLESTVFLSQVNEDSFLLSYKDIVSSFRIE